MKKLAWKVVALGASLMAAILAVGQTNQIETIADIPFAFERYSSSDFQCSP
jgi:hypothetical protein